MSRPSSSVSFVTQMRRRAIWIHHPPTETPRIGTLKSNGRVHDSAHEFLAARGPQRCRASKGSSLPTGAPLRDASARSWPAIQSASATGAAFGAGSAKGATCRTAAIRRLTGSGISHAPATGSIEPTCRSGMSTKGRPLGSKTEVFRARRTETTARRTPARGRPGRAGPSACGGQGCRRPAERSREQTRRRESRTNVPPGQYMRVWRTFPQVSQHRPARRRRVPAAAGTRTVPWRPAVTGAASLGTPVGIGMLRPLLGEVIAVTECGGAHGDRGRTVRQQGPERTRFSAPSLVRQPPRTANPELSR